MYKLNEFVLKFTLKSIQYAKSKINIHSNLYTYFVCAFFCSSCSEMYKEERLKKSYLRRNVVDFVQLLKRLF